ncbi:MAG: transcriptional repressor DicA [Microgenomates bacterium OLB22]|nr:MAG: transcriptional repressor DicA [Microgenomates bacterium OLB22]
MHVEIYPYSYFRSVMYNSSAHLLDTHAQEGKMTTATLGSFIRQKRVERNLTSTELSTAIGKSSSYISMVERGANPSEKALRSIERVLGCSIPRTLPCRAIKNADGEPRYQLVRRTTLAQQITRSRLKKRLSQAKAAELAGLSIFVYREIEVGTRTPTPKQMRDISGALDLDLSNVEPLPPYVPVKKRTQGAVTQVPFSGGQGVEKMIVIGSQTIMVSDACYNDIQRILLMSDLQSPQAAVERSLMIMRRILELAVPQKRASLAS